MTDHAEKWSAYIARWKAQHADIVAQDAEFFIDGGWHPLLDRAVERLGMYPKTWRARLEGGKEKHGCLILHIPADYAIPGCRAEVERLREELRLSSLAMCEVCGEQGRLRLGSYARTLCDQHATDMTWVRDDDGIHADPWKWTRRDPMTTDSKLSDIKISKRLSSVLRHNPDAIGITLDAQGWTPVRTLLAALKKDGIRLDEARLRHVVETNDKRRFTLSEDGQRIRAAQGHSVEVDLGLLPADPPAVLYHGTAAASLDSIFASGILPRSRRQVHLSVDRETALKVGGRHGRAVVLVIDAASMVAAEHLFYRADNGVWLVDQVPPAFLTFESNG